MSYKVGKLRKSHFSSKTKVCSEQKDFHGDELCMSNCFPNTFMSRTGSDSARLSSMTTSSSSSSSSSSEERLKRRQTKLRKSLPVLFAELSHLNNQTLEGSGSSNLCLRANCFLLPKKWNNFAQIFATCLSKVEGANKGIFSPSWFVVDEKRTSTQ